MKVFHDDEENVSRKKKIIHMQPEFFQFYLQANARKNINLNLNFLSNSMFLSSAHS